MNEKFEQELEELLQKAQDLNYGFYPGREPNTKKWLVKQALRTIVSLLLIITSEKPNLNQLSSATYSMMYVRLVALGKDRDFKNGEDQDRAIHAEARRWGRL